ncbi:amidohydrolase [Firmicutes bacterium CAG:466]|nr:amidohydrolase [Firmicutes bacterium CAG:466]
MTVKPYVLAEKAYLTDLRRHFHAHPEVSLQEYETCKKIEGELDSMGIPHKRIGETGVYGWIDGKKAGDGVTVALRADIDALAMEDLKEVPYHSQNAGVCHACGHDAHTATLLTVAKILKAKENEFSGQVRLFFQQAEEIGQGARQFVQAGLLDGVTRVFGAHVTSHLDSGKISLTAGPQNASCDYFKIQIHGKGAHVSTPQLGVDALYIASQIVVQLQTIVSRNTDPLETVVVGVGKLQAGTQYNIVAEHAVLEGTTRSFLPEVRKFTNDRVVRIAKETAALYGAEAEVEFLDFAAPLVNDAKAVEEVTAVTAEFLPREDIISDFQKALGADDFADYLAVTRGMYAFVGTRNSKDPHTAVAHHHGLFDVDEEALLISCNVYVDYALWVLNEKPEA